VSTHERDAAPALPVVAFDGSRPLGAQLPNVASAAWTAFVRALTLNDDPRDGVVGKPRAFHKQTAAGGFGAFDLRPLRLADLGIMRHVRRDNSSGRVILIGDFVAPMTQTKFLFSPLAQYNALIDSLRRFDNQTGKLQLPTQMTRSGVLALLHRLGPHALDKWARHRETNTLALYARTNGLF